MTNAVMADVVELLFSMVICVIIAGVSGITLSWAILLLPFVCLLQFILVSSFSIALSCLYVFIRDLGHIYEAFLRLLIFITPIFYDPSFLGKGLGNYILLLNPLSHLINFSRMLIIDGTPLPLQSSMALLLLTAILLFCSFKLFKRYEPRFSEHL